MFNAWGALDYFPLKLFQMFLKKGKMCCDGSLDLSPLFTILSFQLVAILLYGISKLLKIGLPHFVE